MIPSNINIMIPSYICTSYDNIMIPSHICTLKNNTTMPSYICTLKNNIMIPSYICTLKNIIMKPSYIFILKNNIMISSYIYTLKNNIMIPFYIYLTGPRSTICSPSDCRSRDRKFDSGPSVTFVEIYHEIISMVILLLPLIQKGLLSDTSESMCTKYWLTA